MKYYSKTHTPVQRRARRILRIAVRGLRDCRAINPAELSSDDRRRELQASIRLWERIVKAFEEATTDAQLEAALDLVGTLSEGADQNQSIGQRH